MQYKLTTRHTERLKYYEVRKIWQKKERKRGCCYVNEIEIIIRSEREAYQPSVECAEKCPGGAADEGERALSLIFRAFLAWLVGLSRGGK